MDEPMDDEVPHGAVVEGSDVMDVEGPAQPADATANGDQKMEENRLSGSFTWPLANFSKMAPDKLFSDQFEIGTHLWRLLIFPRGNKQPTNHLALYLEAPEASYTPQRMAPKAAFKLTLLNHLDEKKSFHKEATHTFSSSETDWGFTQFLPLEDIFAKGSGFLDANDTLIIRVDVTLLKDNPEWDSRKETGCVGLKNQGATCYMNSLLQYLYQVPYFRKAVYHMPTPENEEPSKSLPLALQSLFYKLQYSRIAVSTKDLTKAFGWGTYDAFQQHDVQELNRVLCEKLEEKMKGTKVEKVINDLFEGHTELRIECLHVPYKSQPKCESFMDLQLDVKGCKNIYDSFDRQTEVETLEGNNKYHAEHYGLQDAKRGMKFKSFPPVLQLQLKRFEYDFQRDTMVKINDRYEFFDELDLDCDNRRYLTEDSDPSVRNKYRLHSVLSHTGGVHGGHYYAFIRPDGKTWLKFDDEKVTKEDEHKAMEDQFGGEDENPPPAPGYTNVPTFKFTKYSNAYMLVYVRESDWDRVMCDVTKDDIAEHLREYLEQEQRDKEMRKKEKEEAHLYCTLRVATEEDMISQVGKQRHFDLVDHDKLPPATGHYRMRKQTRFLDFKREVERRTGVPVDKQRYWSWSRRQNGTLRVSRMLTPEEEQGTLMDLREHREQGAPATKHALMELKFFLELPKGGLAASASLHDRKKQEVLLFFKLYDPVSEQLRFLGAMYVHKNARVAEMKMLVVVAAGEELSPDVELEYYEEIKWEPSVMCEQLDSRKSLANSGLEDGDIVCCQRALTAEEAASCRFPSVARYLEYIRNRRVVQVRRVDDPKGDAITLEMLREDSYDKVTAAIAAAIGNGAEAHKLRLTQHNAYSHQPQRQPVKWQGVQRLEQMLTHASHQTDVLYYELLDMPLEKLEQLKTLKVWFHNDKTEAASEHIVRLPKGSSAGDLLAELRRMLGAGYEDKQLRLLEVMHSKIFKVIDPADGIDMINDQYWQLRAEVIPDDQLPGSNLRVVPVYHCTLDTSSSAAAGKDTAATTGAAGGTLQLSATNFGEPFFFAIAEDETLKDLKPRIQAKLGVPDEEFAKWQFAFVTFKPPSEALRDDDVVAARFAKAAAHGGGLHSSGENYLALVHEDKGGPRRQTHSSYRFPHEKPVKIYS